MKFSTKLMLLASVVLFSSMPAMAHSGDHSHGVLVWLAHLLTSIDHLFALGALALVVGAAIVGWHYWYPRLKRNIQSTHSVHKAMTKFQD